MIQGGYHLLDPITILHPFMKELDWLIWDLIGTLAYKKTQWKKRCVKWSMV